MIRKKGRSAEEIELAKREIEILKCCQHPNIIRLYDVFENYNYIYIVMELLQGGDMYSYLEKRDFHLSEARACSIMHSLATALYYLHSYGIVHRDLKLDNIMMVDETEESNVKIVDFGLSKIVGPNEMCKDRFGTLGYVAPEVIQGKTYDKSVDIFSLGVIAYIMLSGSSPFEDETDEKIMK